MGGSGSLMPAGAELGVTIAKTAMAIAWVTLGQT
jgi:short subunit fatty acids transporter